jgi:nitrite reductase/ring-hydroxylating ferredoxin subunit
MGGFTKIAKLDDIQPGQARMFEVGGKSIALFNVDGLFYAIDDTCTHRGSPLSEGELDVTCPWHGAVFDVTTGRVLRPPAPREISSYRTRVDGEDVEVEV